MRDKIITVSILFLFFSLTAVGCSSSSSGPEPGADGDWEAADLLDNDDGDALDRDAPDGDSDADLLTDTEENEPEITDGDEEPANESEQAESDDVDSDEISDSEEGEAVEPGIITMEELPWEGVAVAACDGNTDTDASLAASRAVWGDDRGTVYFGGDQFWIFTENGETQTLTCDGGMLWPMFSMDGRIVDNGNELWTGHDGRIGQFVDSQWSFIDLPAEMLAATKVEGDDNRVVDIDIAGDVVAVLTGAKLGFYNPTTHQWQVSTGCPDNLNRDYGLAFDGEKLWASAGVFLYTVNLQTAVCQQEVTVVQEPDDLEAVGITGADADGVWMAAYRNTQYSVVLLTADGVLHDYIFPEKEYVFTNAIPPGTGGNPILGFTFMVTPYYGCVPPPTPMESTIEASYRLEVSIPGSQPHTFSRPESLCIACSGMAVSSCINHATNTIYKMCAKNNWRGSNTLWHLYEKPRRYRW